MIVKLRMMNSKQAGASLQILKSPYLIGRHADCDLKVASSRVSVHHCAILLHDGKASVKDLDSTNGTRVNGEPIHGERDLIHGDVIWVGPALVEVLFEKDLPDILEADSTDYSATSPYIEVPGSRLLGGGPKTERTPKDA